MELQRMERILQVLQLDWLEGCLLLIQFMVLGSVGYDWLWGWRILCLSGMLSRCKHDVLAFDPSSNAKRTGYSRHTQQQRIAATRPSGRASKSAIEDSTPDASTFPAPLVLPGDDLSWDPKYDTQSLKSWLQLPERNRVTDDRRTIYVVPVPFVAREVKYVRDWAQPKLIEDRSAVDEKSTIARPRHEDVVEYLAAFYTNIPVKLLSEPKLQFTSWGDKRSAKKRVKVSNIALSIGSEAVRIRARQSKDGVFSNQLNLDDLLDAAISLVPSDAYALLLLVAHDLYEEEDDDFCCGRAYGGSRVAVVSSARYNPALDVAQTVEVEHAWPASHCQAYIDTYLEDSDSTRSPSRKKAKITGGNQAPTRLSSALRETITAFTSIPATSQSDGALWLSRICKTASHELGHCFGIDHCIYYACSMQGSASLSEDARQPPYLCPVDLSKILRATGADSSERYEALLEFCQRFEAQDRGFAAFAAWLRHSIA